MTTEEKLDAIEHEIMMNEELINRDDVITLIARKHLSKEENFHSAITRLNRQVKALKPITIKAELTEILEKIKVELASEAHDNKCDEFVDGINHALEIIDKHISGEGDKED